MHAIIKTSQGDIHLDLYPEHTPHTVANFIVLAQEGYYDWLNFHRVIEDFMIQWWCPHGTGTGGPGYNFQDEFHEELRHDKPGKLSMANAWPWTNGSQFFITHTETPWLDGRHSVFGAVRSDDDQLVVNNIKQGDSIEKIVINAETEAFLETMAEFVNTIKQSLWKL